MVTSETVVTDEHPLAIEDDEVRYFFPYIYICIHHLGAFMTNIRPSFFSPRPAETKEGLVIDRVRDHGMVALSNSMLARGPPYTEHSPPPLPYCHFRDIQHSLIIINHQPALYIIWKKKGEEKRKRMHLGSRLSCRADLLVNYLSRQWRWLGLLH